VLDVGLIEANNLGFSSLEPGTLLQVPLMLGPITTVLFSVSTKSMKTV